MPSPDQVGAYASAGAKALAFTGSWFFRKRRKACAICMNLENQAIQLQELSFRYYKKASSPTEQTAPTYTSDDVLVAQGAERLRADCKTATGLCRRRKSTKAMGKSLNDAATRIWRSVTGDPFRSQFAAMQDGDPKLREIGAAFTDFLRLLTKFRNLLEG